jgi:hypothetical protein
VTLCYNAGTRSETATVGVTTGPARLSGTASASRRRCSELFSTDGSAIMGPVPREIEVAEDAFRIRYSGLIRLFLGREVAVPYAEIESVEVGLRELPFYSPMAKRRVRPGAIVRGRFKNRGRWYFLDFYDRDRAVMIVTRPGSRYSVLGIEPDGDPEALAKEIRARL